MLVVTNAESLGQVLLRLMEQELDANVRILRLTYSDCINQLTRDLIVQTDFFILELFRQYPGGLRAEGLALAERFARHGKGSLIISPLFLAQQVGCHLYWDASSSEPLMDRILNQMMNSRPDHIELDRLTNIFAQFLELPPQHKS